MPQVKFKAEDEERRALQAQLTLSTSRCEGVAEEKPALNTERSQGVVEERQRLSLQEQTSSKLLGPAIAARDSAGFLYHSASTHTTHTDLFDSPSRKSWRQASWSGFLNAVQDVKDDLQDLKPNETLQQAFPSLQGVDSDSGSDGGSASSGVERSPRPMPTPGVAPALAPAEALARALTSGIGDETQQL